MSAVELKAFIQEKVVQYAPEKEELWKETENNPLPSIKVYPEVLFAQVIGGWNLLDEESREWVIEACEKKRQKIGRVMNRMSDSYMYWFIDETLDRLKRDLDDGDIILKQNLMKDWEFSKKTFFFYNPDTGEKLLFNRFLGISDDQNVYLVIKDGTNWVVKWENVDDDVNAEVLEYDKLEAMGAQCPKRLNGFKFLDFGVLVIEFLQPLDSTDRPSEVAKQLLTTQLQYIHTYACYFDLKTDNIRKRNGTPPVYFIIDMNLSTVMGPDGTFERKHWTPLYASQQFPRLSLGGVQISSYVNDFLELLYVLHQLIAQRAYESKTSVFKDERSRHAYGNTFPVLLGDFFADPDRMSKHEISNTTRGWKTMRSLLEFPLDFTTSGITKNFMMVIQSLRHGFPPAHIHSLLASQISVSSETIFFNETAKTLAINCSICSNANAQYKCGDCYHETTPLCSDACAMEHICK